MTPEKYQRLKPLFEQALDTPPGQRSAFILKIRIADEELGGELARLIESHDDTSDAGTPPDPTRSMEAPLIRFHDVFPDAFPGDNASFAPGEMLIDRFRIVRFIGRGGMGEVYEAEDLQLGRVALKTIRSNLADKPGMLARFRKEVQLARRVTSPGVCRIHELFTLPGSDQRGAAAFLTMEFLEGETLAERLDREGALPLPEARTIALQLCAAAQAIHDAGVIHRDLKSRNVMLVPRNGALQVVVMDLGLARDSATTPEGEAGLTMPGAVMGTPHCMAPEQFEGKQATPATDIYAMGVLFYEIVTGKPPFRGGTPIAAAVRRAKRLAPASSVREKLPRQWDIVIDRCLEYDPEKRFQSAAAVAEALEGKRPSRIRGFAGYAVAASLLIAIAAGTLRLPALKHLSGSAGVQVTPAKTMVVLPFENLGGDPANQAFCDGLQETTTSMLSQAEKLKDTIMIVPSSEVRKDQVKTIADARKVFNASLALTGSVQKSADSLQLTLNLTDVQSMRQRDSRILMVKTNEFASLPQRLASQIDSMLGEGSVLRTQQAAIGETTRDPEAYKLYLQGQGAVRNLKWGAAIDYLQKALARDPNFAPAAGKLAEACVRQYNTSRDTKWLARADLALNESARKEQTPEVRLAQAMIWQATGETSRAVPLFKELLQSEPNNVDIWDLLAQTLKVAGRTAEAEETYQAAVRLRPGYWPAYNTMGVFYEDQNDSQKAEQTFLTGISLAPQVPILHSNLGTLYFGLSRWAEAEREFRRSLALRPNAPGYSNLGTVLFFEGKYVDAAGQDIEATKLQPANHVPWGNLGDARWQIPGERERAREAFQNAYLLASRQIVLNPGDAQLRKSAALYLAKLGRLNEARTEIENAIHQSPKDMYVRFYAARVFAVVGDPKRAETEALASVELGYDSKQVELEPDLKSLQVRQLARAGGKSRAQP